MKRVCLDIIFTIFEPNIPNETMIYRFLLLSDEVDKFKREIKISSQATFLDLHDAILESVGYSKDEMASFFICDEDWNRRTEIALIEMDSSSEEDIYVMEDTPLEELLEEEQEKLIYIFDYAMDRGFYMELKEIILGKNLSDPICSLAQGKPPKQIVDDEDFVPKATTTNNIEEDFYGDSDYNPDEIDTEGFEGLDNEDEPAEDSFEGEEF